MYNMIYANQQDIHWKCSVYQVDEHEKYKS